MSEPGLVLVGLPASGKSTVGRLVAERLGRPYLDTDALVERRLGTPVAAYLARHGEAAFRRIEAEAVVEACAATGAVIAAGGGAVLDPLNRWSLWGHGAVAWLDAPPAVLVARLAADPVPRPTFQPYRAERLAAALGERIGAYRAADLRLDASRPPAVVAAELAGALMAPRGRRLYDAEVDRHHPMGPPRARIVMGVGLASSALPDEAVTVVDRRLLTRAPELVARLGRGPRLAIAGGERAKRLRRLEGVLDWLVEVEAERTTAVVAVGGGTVGDLAGTAAALHARGLPLVQVPTTWLAQADSAIGGKVAVDLRAAKNAAGAFWPPTAVVSDVAWLRSLPVALRRDGAAESVKTALMGDPALWELLERRGVAALRRDEAARYAIVERSARLKLAVTERDPYEAGERRRLNLGHTLGHALEVASAYRLRHGSAVALGMRAAAAIAAGRGADPQLAPRLDTLLDALGLPLRHPFQAHAVRLALRSDKKRRAGQQRWILPMRVGEVIEADDVTDAELERALRAIAA